LTNTFQQSNPLSRLESAFKLSFNKSKYEKKLCELKEENSTLRQVVEDICSFNKKDTQRQSKPHSAIPEYLSKVHAAAQRLFEALTEVWCCDPTHISHHLRLCIDVLNENGVQFDLAVSYMSSGISLDSRYENFYCTAQSEQSQE
jgi:hypothetical protein